MVAIGSLYERIRAARHRGTFTPPGRFVDVGGHRLHMICAGSGSPPVFLESGIAASSLSWALVQPTLADLTRVCAYDRAGLAWSEAPSCPRTFERIVDELRAVTTDVAPGQRCVLVGHSFGSFVVRAYAARHPEEIVGVVLVDPPTEWLTITRQRARMLWGARHLSNIGALLARLGVVRACLALLSGGAPGVPRQFVKIFGPTAARTLERLVGEVQKLPAELHPVIQAHWGQPKCFRAMADYLQALEHSGSSISALVPPRNVPVVVISSDNQSPEQMAAHQRIAEAAGHGQHIVAARSGHWVQFDQPEVIVAVVRELIESERSHHSAQAADGAVCPRMP